MPDTTAEAALERKSAAAHRVGWGFIALYTLAFMSNCLVFLAPLLVTLALKVNSLVGIEQAPSSLAVVTGIGALLAIVGNPFFGRILTSRQTEAVRVGWPNMLGRTLGAEWIKLRSVRSTYGSLLAAVVVTVGIAALAGWAATTDDQPTQATATQLAGFGASLGQFGLVALAALRSCSPRRSWVLWCPTGSSPRPWTTSRPG
jgi:hypothetical protein